MSTFSPNDKVICINSTPPPLNRDRHSAGHDFSFPSGFVEEGEIYCVQAIEVGRNGYPSIRLVGKPVFQHNQEVGWNALLFRKVAPRKRNLVAQSKQHLLGHPVRTLVHRI